MRKQPRPHQRKALGNIVPSIVRKKLKRVTVIMPCGTGKTMVQLWTAEAVKPKTALVLLPSLALVRQTLNEWMPETTWKNPDVLCVCSDKTIGRSKSMDEIEISAEDIGYPVTSDSDEIREFLSRKSIGVKLVFSTYHSSPLVAVGMRKGFAFDLAVFDEAHVTAGAEGGFFSFALKDENLRIKVRTFWTATPRHYDIDKAGKDGAPLAYSMDDESVYGPVVHKLSFKAAVPEIICDYEVLVSVITNKMIGVEAIETGEVIVRGQKVPAKIVAHHMAIDQAIKRYGVRKIFTFHPRVKDAEEFTNGGPQSVARHIPRDFRVLHVNGGMTTMERETLLEEFRKAVRALMSNARCLTQGIDVPGVDMVAFLSKKRSLIDIVQATGRAMRKAPGKTKGYILVPLYVNQDEGETVGAAVERSEFREVVAVLNALREQDDALADNVSRLRAERGDGDGGTRDIDKVTILGPQVDLKRLRAAITTICVDRLARGREIYATWQEASEGAKVLGLSSQQKYRASYQKDSRLPVAPERRYPDFPGWPKFLRGADPKYGTWQEAGKAVRKLGLLSQRKYNAGYKKDSRLPAAPHLFYPDFPNWLKFLRDADPKELYVTWQEASKAARRLGLSTCTEYKVGYKKDPRLPGAPNMRYPDFPGWPKFLRDTDPKQFYATWQEASQATRRLGLSSQKEYKAGYKQDPCLPGHPFTFYTDFPSWLRFLGRK